jgi:hypothetical protein
MLAAPSAVLPTASPLGTPLGGPLTTALGPRGLGGSGLASVMLVTVACVLLLARRRSPSERSGIEKHGSPSRG